MQISACYTYRKNRKCVKSRQRQAPGIQNEMPRRSCQRRLFLVKLQERIGDSVKRYIGKRAGAIFTALVVAVVGIVDAVVLPSPGLSQVYAASTHTKLMEGTYQLLDGTAVGGILARGIDVSHWQGSIDWERVARDDISFVMLGTRYNGNVDPRFRENAEAAARAGVKLGAYIYSYATDVTMAEAEADFVLDLIKDYPISYPVAFDVEADVQRPLSPDLLADMINAFCRKIADAGYHPVLYANDYWLANEINMDRVDCDVWVARYETRHEFGDPVMWQASSTGRVDGITGNVDIDFQYEDFSPVIRPDLWRTIGGNTYYYKNFLMQKDTWIHDGTGWFYMDPGGLAATGWMTLADKTYYLDPASGRMHTGWLSTDEGWRHLADSGELQTGWIHDGSAWYYLNRDALMHTGWLQDGQTWYHLGSSGAMSSGWRLVDGVWYYFADSGAMQTGWRQIDGVWYYLAGSGAMQTGRQQIDGAWYYLADSGAMQTGWKQIDGSWYYFSGSGAMKTGWVGDDSAWYYLDPASGVMYANTQITVDGVTYQVDGNGVCVAVPDNGGDGNTAGENAAGAGAIPETEATAGIGNVVEIEALPGTENGPGQGDSQNGVAGPGQSSVVTAGNNSPGASGIRTETAGESTGTAQIGTITVGGNSPAGNTAGPGNPGLAPDGLNVPPFGG